eukprot:6926432-Prymnesium_polylepis.1
MRPTLALDGINLVVVGLLISVTVATRLVLVVDAQHTDTGAVSRSTSSRRRLASTLWLFTSRPINFAADDASLPPPHLSVPTRGPQRARHRSHASPSPRDQ